MQRRLRLRLYAVASGRPALEKDVIGEAEIDLNQLVGDNPVQLILRGRNDEPLATLYAWYKENLAIQEQQRPESSQDTARPAIQRLPTTRSMVPLYISLRNMGFEDNGTKSDPLAAVFITKMMPRDKLKLSISDDHFFYIGQTRHFRNETDPDFDKEFSLRFGKQSSFFWPNCAGHTYELFH